MPNWTLGRFTGSAAVRLIGVLVLSAVLFAGTFVQLHAQDVDLLGSAERQTAQTRDALARIASEVSAPFLTSALLADQRSGIDSVKADAIALIPRLQAAANEIDARLNQLGSAPAEGISEPTAIATERRSLSDALGRYRAAEKQLTLLAVEADQQSARVARLQRDLFLRRVFEPSRSIVNPRLWLEGAASWSLVFERTRALIEVWFRDARSRIESPNLMLLVTGALLFLIAGLSLAFVVARRFGYASQIAAPTNFDRLWRPLWRLIVTLLIFAFVLLGLIALLETFEVATSRARALIIAVFNFLVNAVALLAFGGAVLSPGSLQWRLPALDDDTARRLGAFLTAGAAAFALDELSSDLVDLLFLPIAFSVGQSAILTLAMILTLAGGILTLRGNRTDQFQAPAQRFRGRRFYFGWVAKLAQPLWILLGISLLALVFGYVAFGHFVVFQIVHTLLLVFIFYLLHHLVDEIVATSSQPHSIVGRFLRQKLSLSDRAVERIGVVFGAGADIAIVLIGVPIIFLQWTINWIDLRSWLSKAWLGFQIADTRIYPSTLLMALAVLVIGIIVTNIITSWVDRRVLMRTHLDKGVRESIRKGVSYTGILLASVIALTSAGVEFSNIAIIAGALGVGIGFGLQSIVNNFVSGLILLAERPVKVGDWIVLGAGEGIVKRINVRSTEINTFDRATIIVPNSDLISEPVLNRTHGGTMSKAIIETTVHVDSDPELVKTVLMQCATGHAGVSRDPEPMVQLAEIGESGLRFQLHFFVEDALTAVPTASELRFAIVKAFRAKRIELALPLRDLVMRASTGPPRSPVPRGSK
jgi:potassium efflux system protein